MSHWKPKGKKRPREWHRTAKQDRIFAERSRALDDAYTQCVRCPDTAFRLVYGVGPLCECCFDGWWQEERLSG